MMNRNVWRKITALLLLGLLLLPVLAQENEIAITARQNLALQSKPDYDSDVLGVFPRGEQANAFGRDESGAWLHIADGWIAAKNVDAAGDVMSLPVTTNAVTVKAASSRSLRSGPDGSFDMTGNLPSGETTLALGRNGGGSWLQVADGWLPADQVEISGDVMALPITFSSITIHANINAALRRGPSRDAEVLAILARGESVIATSRNEAGTAVQTTRGWVFINRGLALEGEVMELPLAPTVSVTAVQSLTLYRWPALNSDSLSVVQQGEQDIAFGRNEAGDWLQIPGGWVSAEQGLETRGDVMRLPITGQAGITITTKLETGIRSGPSEQVKIGILRRGEEAIAFGRNEKATRLQIESGWVIAGYVKADGNIMELPVTSGESSTQSIAKTSSRDGVTITSTAGSTIRSEPRFGRNVVGNLQRGEEAVAIGRTERGSWLQIESGWVSASFVKASGDIMTLPVTSGESSAQSIAKASPRDGITITLKYDILSVWSRPSVASDHDRVGSLQRGEGSLAIGRNKTGTWLRIEDGWVVANLVKVDGDIMSLPITSGESSTQSVAKALPRNGIIVTAKYLISVSSGSGTSGRVGRLQRGEEALAIGRNEDGTKLQIESGWVLASMVRADGDIMSLPITSGESSAQSIAKASPRNGITIKATLPRGSVIRSEPRTIGNSTVGSLQRGEETVAIGRNKAGTYLQIESGWVLAAWVKADGDIMSLPITSGESSAQSIAKVSSRNGVTIKTTLLLGSSIRSRPTIKANLVGSLQRDEEAVAIGRNEDGRWLRIEDGWVLASYVKADGDIMLLPVTSEESSTQSVAKASPRDGVTITLSRFDSFPVRNAPRSDVSVRFLQKGEEALAIGRDQAGTWLQIEDGWVYGDYFRVDGDLMDLPVTSSTVARTATTSTRATPTPTRSASSAFNANTIRSQVNRYTDDVRILKISQSGGTTSIEYDLKPWHFVPNEQIAHEVLFKMICALRRGGQIPHKLEFVGQGHFKSDVGRKFKSPSVEIHISANNANRIVCSGNNYTDINWRSLSSFYKSYPIPRGATVDD